MFDLLQKALTVRTQQINLGNKIKMLQEEIKKLDQKEEKLQFELNRRKSSIVLKNLTREELRVATNEHMPKEST